MSISPPFRRVDRRAPTEMRPIDIEVGHLARVDGSATFGFGPDQILASFHGPSDVGLRDELVDRSTLKISHRPLEGTGATPSKALSAVLAPIYEALLSLHSFPRSLTQLTLQSLTPAYTSSSSSHRIPMSIRAAAVNASTLAILDAGSVGMRGTPIACSVAVVSKKGKERIYGDEDEDVMMDQSAKETRVPAAEELEFILDPSSEEEDGAVARFVVGWVFGSGLGKKEGKEQSIQETRDEAGQDDESNDVNEGAECVYMESEGVFDFVMLQKAYAATRQACKIILGQIREELLEREMKDPNVHLDS